MFKIFRQKYTTILTGREHGKEIGKYSKCNTREYHFLYLEIRSLPIKREFHV